MCAFLEAQHPHKTAEHVAARLRCLPSRIRKMLERRAAPDFSLGFEMMRAYGPDFAAAVLPGCAWLSETAARERHAKLVAKSDALNAEIAASLQRIGGRA